MRALRAGSLLMRKDLRVLLRTCSGSGLQLSRQGIGARGGRYSAFAGLRQL